MDLCRQIVICFSPTRAENTHVVLITKVLEHLQEHLRPKEIQGMDLNIVELLRSKYTVLFGSRIKCDRMILSLVKR